MEALRIETTVTTDGELKLTNTSLHAGDAVEVIVLVRETAGSPATRYPLRGTALRYDDPTVPVASDEWDATR
ncbi:MAG: hypothetical protein WCJ30_26330 [Deltaproteobacteria bacterium]